MTIPFAILAFLTLAGAVAAMSLRNLVHCALCLVITFAGLAGLFLQLGAQFVGLAQVLVYIGAVAILIVFAILLTRGAEPTTQGLLAGGWGWGVGVAVVAFGCLAICIARSSLPGRLAPTEPTLTARGIGDQLMTSYVLPLEVIALLLTAALIGAVLIAMHEKHE
jgi:NADH-quinone oxidoreductase subunit J